MIDVALKEWKVICDLLLSGRLAFLLRKGGVIEDAGPGRFELQHHRFALYPSWAHQRPGMLKPAYRPAVQVMDEPAELTLEGIGRAVAVWQVPSRQSLQPLDDLHPWTDRQLDMRWNYKPENPLYLVAVRVCRLARPKRITVGLAYGGCRSWVPLTPEDAVDETGAAEVMGCRQFEQVLKRIAGAMGRAPQS